jgi:hypothetical protein
VSEEPVVEEPEAVEAAVAEAPLGDSQEVIPMPTGRRSMGFFARS